MLHSHWPIQRQWHQPRMPLGEGPGTLGFLRGSQGWGDALFAHRYHTLYSCMPTITILDHLITPCPIRLVSNTDWIGKDLDVKHWKNWIDMHHNVISLVSSTFISAQLQATHLSPLTLHFSTDLHICLVWSHSNIYMPQLYFNHKFNCHHVTTCTVFACTEIWDLVHQLAHLSPSGLYHFLKESHMYLMTWSLLHCCYVTPSNMPVNRDNLKIYSIFIWHNIWRCVGWSAKWHLGFPHIPKYHFYILDHLLTFSTSGMPCWTLAFYELFFTSLHCVNWLFMAFIHLLNTLYEPTTFVFVHVIFPVYYFLCTCRQTSHFGQCWLTSQLHKNLIVGQCQLTYQLCKNLSIS